MRKKALTYPKVVKLLNENFRLLRTYAEKGNVDELYKSEVLYDSVILRTKFVYYIITKYKKILTNHFNEKEFLYLETLLSLLKDFTRNHFADLWFFLYKKLPQYKIKIVKN